MPRRGAYLGGGGWRCGVSLPRPCLHAWLRYSTCKNRNCLGPAPGPVLVSVRTHRSRAKAGPGQKRLTSPPPQHEQHICSRARPTDKATGVALNLGNEGARGRGGETRVEARFGKVKKTPCVIWGSNNDWRGQRRPCGGASSNRSSKSWPVAHQGPRRARRGVR